MESGPPGIAWFDAGGLKTLHGGTLDGVLAATRRALGGRPALGAAPSRFAALAAAEPRARPARRRSPRWPRRRSPPTWRRCPSRCCARARRPRTLPDALERFGIRTLGELAKLPRAALADRFGAAGPLARDLAQGKDTPLVPRTAAERLEERLELPESASGAQLEHGLGLLIDRLLARRERRGRALRAVVLSARLVEGGTWRARMTFREPLADPRRMRLVLGRSWGSCPRRPTCCACAPRASARRRATSARCWPSRPRSAAPGCARRSARPARSRARTPRCASSPSIPTRACPSGASRSRHGIREAPRRAAAARGARGEGGRPLSVGGRAVEAVRESWLVEDRWWTDEPLRRRYWEVVTADGRDLVVFRDLGAAAGSRSGEWRLAIRTLTRHGGAVSARRDGAPNVTPGARLGSPSMLVLTFAASITHGAEAAEAGTCHSTIAAYARHGRHRSAAGTVRRAPQPQVARRPRVRIPQRAHRDVLDRPRPEPGQRQQRRARRGEVERRVEPQPPATARGERAQRPAARRRHARQRPAVRDRLRRRERRRAARRASPRSGARPPR